ncbi:electron transport complex subunit RsxB [Vibrio sagamiensis]|uniref:Ion-translocating oxidoreductase complex subunit B n=1 Tax=Vibrio sagamiensis NBRC 104589 TaxID=1219064 RepID=A0A511QGP7_9VIBR|nr:electron transport complex subunit RsxB [Vibrio sagamiensis]PNQ62505.1 electron transport complex subunit RsxB [Vibrio agarivorans]GEM76377.1 electron transport complex subunit B [Vibrio sagamiensis NBRC 104589]
MNTIFIAIIAIALLAAIFGAILGFASIRFKVEADPIVDQIDSLLPQTQCGQCGYPGCRPYAEAIANGDKINKCPPGGQATIEKLADLMGVEAEESAHDLVDNVKTVAFIHEDMCIGCTKCIQACPVDAIVGGTKALHTVIKDECTGCDLCVAPCPTDCIEMIPLETTTDSWKWQLNAIPVTNITDAADSAHRSNSIN